MKKLLKHEEDNAIRFLVLAAAEADQPGPLVSLLAGQKSGKLTHSNCNYSSRPNRKSNR